MEEYRIRAGIFASIILVVLAILGLRLGYMQLIDSDTYVREASNNAFREELIRPARGAIYDRNGALMVSNVPTYSVSLTPRYFPRAKGNRKQYDSTKVSLLARLLAVPTRRSGSASPRPKRAILTLRRPRSTRSRSKPSAV